MATINIDYKELYSISKKISELGNGINEKMKNIYNELNSLNSDWTGQRYDELIYFCNQFKSINERTIRIYGQDIPNALCEIAEKYEIADTNNVSEKKHYEINSSLPEIISTNNTTVLKFLDEEIKLKRSKIITYIEEIQNDVNTITSKCNVLTWYGKTAEAFKPKVIHIKTNTKKILDYFKNEIMICTEKARNEMGKAEYKSTII